MDERQFKLFFVVTDSSQAKLMKEEGWKDFMISVVYWDRVYDPELFDADDTIMVDNGYITKFFSKMSKGEEISLNEKIQHADWVMKRYFDIHKELKSKGIKHYFFDFDWFLGKEEYDFRKKYFKKMFEIFGRDVLFVVYHEGEEDHLKWVKEDLGIDKLAISSALGSKLPYDFHKDFGFNWVHYFGTFSESVMRDAMYGRVDSADISTWANTTKYGQLRVFENGQFRDEDVGLGSRFNRLEFVRKQVREYIKAVQYIDDMGDVKLKSDVNHIYCDTCPIRDKCDNFRAGGYCFLEEMEDVKVKDDILEELMWLVKDLKKKMLYESLKAQMAGLTATKMQLNLLRMYISLLQKAEDIRIKRMELKNVAAVSSEKDKMMRLLQVLDEADEVGMDDGG